MTLEAFCSLSARNRRAVESEAERLLHWLRPDAGKRELSWKQA
jgi:hypothetical protein